MKLNYSQKILAVPHTHVLRRHSCLLHIIAVVFLLTFGGPVSAAEQCQIERDVQAGAFTEGDVKKLNKIYENIGDEKYNEAAIDLTKMLDGARTNFLKATINQALAQVEWARERYPQALKNFEAAVNLDALPNHAHYALMYQISQLYYMNKRFGEALQKLDLWFCAVPKESITPLAYVLKSSINLARENYREALLAIDQAIDLSDKPKENWYQVKLASHFELQQFPEAAKTLETMITKWPEKKVYWTQLSSIYVKLKQDRRALSVLALAYKNGLLKKKSDITQLVSLYQYLDVPYSAAVILDKAIKEGLVERREKTLTQLGDIWYQAAEIDKSLAAFGAAGKLSDNGKIDLRRGYLLADKENWPETSEALASALKKGGLKESQQGEAWLLKGMADFNSKSYTAARKSFGEATRFPKTRNAAQQWITHMAEQRNSR